MIFVEGNMSEDSEEEQEDTKMDIYRRKYHLLMERCEVLQQDNERLVYRIQKSKTILKRMKKQRRALIARLDRYSDTWREMTYQIPLEEHCPESPSPRPVKEEKPQVKTSTPVAKVPTPVEKVIRKTLANSNVKKKINMGNSILIKNTEKMEESNTLLSTKISAEKSARKNPPTGASIIKKKLNPTGQTIIFRTTEKSEKNQVVPKRPANPFFQFCQEQRPLVVEQMTVEQKCGDPEAAKQELTRQLAQKWNNLTTEEKKVYYDRYEISKKKYQQEMQMLQKDWQEVAD